MQAAAVVPSAPAGSSAMNWGDRAFKESFLSTLKDWLDLWYALDDQAKQERMMDAMTALGSLGSWAAMLVHETQNSKWGSLPEQGSKVPLWIRKVAAGMIRTFLAKEQEFLAIDRGLVFTELPVPNQARYACHIFWIGSRHSSRE